MNKHSQNTIDMFNKQDVTVYLTCIKILKPTSFQLDISEAILKVL